MGMVFGVDGSRTEMWKTGVYGSEGIRESECEGVGAGLSDDVVGAKVFFGELF